MSDAYGPEMLDPVLVGGFRASTTTQDHLDAILPSVDCRALRTFAATGTPTPLPEKVGSPR